jgi:ParB/RepB/Spo0J family partition protein
MSGSLGDLPTVVGAASDAPSKAFTVALPKGVRYVQRSSLSLRKHTPGTVGRKTRTGLESYTGAHMSRTATKRRPSRALVTVDVAPSSRPERVAELREIPVALIDLPANPARRFLGDVAALAESLQDYGLQQPISVRVEGDRFRLTSGMRRLTAARMLDWPSITAFVRTLSADDAYLVDLVENMQRQDLSAEEEADALGELVRTRGWTLQQVADALKRSVAYVSKRVRVFEDALLREAVTHQYLPISTAEELLAADAEQRPKLIERALAERWDQGQARDAVRPVELELPLAGQLSNARSDRGVASQARTARPRGFTRAVREFHRLIMAIRADELTTADRSALRSLFRDLVMLGRAPTVATPPVFPELPATPSQGRLTTSRPSRSKPKPKIAAPTSARRRRVR